ncbi:hypothetical protein [Phormidesmis priestleyi]
MLPFNKKIITDELMRPVAVIIDYQDWQKIEKILEAHQANEPAVDINKFAGILRADGEDPLEYQHRIRSEWD